MGALGMRVRCLDPIDDPSYQVLYELMLRIVHFGFKMAPEAIKIESKFLCYIDKV